jgi:hypothetical protein
MAQEPPAFVPKAAAPPPPRKAPSGDLAEWLTSIMEAVYG